MGPAVLFVGHRAPPPARQLQRRATVAEARVHVHAGVVIMKQAGDPQFDEANRAIAAAVQAAGRASTDCILFDLRRVNLANYYSYAVRHAEITPQLGLHANFRVALVGERNQADVLSFIERVGRNRGMNVRRFFDMREALQWLAVSSPTHTAEDGSSG